MKRMMFLFVAIALSVMLACTLLVGCNTDNGGAQSPAESAATYDNLVWVTMTHEASLSHFAASTTPENWGEGVTKVEVRYFSEENECLARNYDDSDPIVAQYQRKLELTLSSHDVLAVQAAVDRLQARPDVAEASAVPIVYDVAGSANVYANMHLTAASKGNVYTLQEALSAEVLTRDDLLSIAYYHNGGVEDNANLMGEDFVPAERYPYVLGSLISRRIKTDIAEYLAPQYSVSLDDIRIYDFYGSYGTSAYSSYIVLIDGLSGIGNPIVDDIHFTDKAGAILVWSIEVPYTIYDNSVFVSLKHEYSGIYQAVDESWFEGTGIPCVRIINQNRYREDSFEGMNENRRREFEANFRRGVVIELAARDQVAVLESVALLEQNEHVQAAGFRGNGYGQAATNDTYYSSQWGLNGQNDGD